MGKLSSYLLKQRKKLRMTQAEVAQEICVSESAVGKYERNERVPRIKTLLGYSRLFHVSIYKLVDLEIEDIKEVHGNE